MSFGSFFVWDIVFLFWKRVFDIFDSVFHPVFYIYFIHNSKKCADFYVLPMGENRNRFRTECSSV